GAAPASTAARRVVGAVAPRRPEGRRGLGAPPRSRRPGDRALERHPARARLATELDAPRGHRVDAACGHEPLLGTGIGPVLLTRPIPAAWLDRGTVLDALVDRATMPLLRSDTALGAQHRLAPLPAWREARLDQLTRLVLLDRPVTAGEQDEHCGQCTAGSACGCDRPAVVHR